MHRIQGIPAEAIYSADSYGSASPENNIRLVLLAEIKIKILNLKIP
jgi:hypothetical protein